MADYGIKIAKQGYDVNDVPTPTTKKNYTILSTESVHKVLSKGKTSDVLTISHHLGFAPYFETYVLRSSPKRAYNGNLISGEFSVYGSSCDSNSVYILEPSGSDSILYIIYLDRP